MEPSTKVEFGVIEWGDAWGDATSAVTERDVPDLHRPEVILTYGWILLSDEIGVSIFSEKCEDGSYRGKSFIPRAMIRNETLLRLSKKRVKHETGGRDTSSAG